MVRHLRDVVMTDDIEVPKRTTLDVEVCTYIRNLLRQAPPQNRHDAHVMARIWDQLDEIEEELPVIQMDTEDMVVSVPTGD
jgi:hypothetical protein